MITDQTTQLLSTLMTVTQQEQRVVANNIANVNTPGYTRQTLDFQQELTRMIKSNDLDRLHALKAEVIDDQTNAPRADGNNVLLANEMNGLMQNSVYFTLLSRGIQSKMNILRTAMS